MTRKTVVVFLLFTFIAFLFLCGFKSDDNLTEITLEYGNYSVTYKDKFIQPTDHLVAEQIFNRKINAPLNEKLKTVEDCLYAGADFKTALLYSFPLLKRTVDEAVAKVNLAPTDSVIKFTPNSYKYFTIIKEKPGRRVDEESLYSSIYCGLKKSSKTKIEINPLSVNAKVTSEDNLKLTYLRARYTTDYSNSNENRKHNIRLALHKINGTVLDPGKEFSFNAAVGMRNESNGFKQAKIILNGSYIDGYGGGVCQASTTVYNCALRADMKITMVNNHSLEPSYVSPSFDAMVNSGSSDLKFRNSGDYPVFIRSYGTDTTAVVEIYGTKLPYTIKTKSELVYQKNPPGDKELLDEKYQYLDKDSESGTKKRVWFSKGETKSRGYLLYYDENNKLLDKKLIRTDIYSSTLGLIAIAP